MALLRTLAHCAQAGLAVAAVMHDVNAAHQLLVMQAGQGMAAGPAEDPALHKALVDVFEGAFSVERVQSAGQPGHKPVVGCANGLTSVTKSDWCAFGIA
jgi:iron complex transport system ATP-binding protein